MTAAPELSIVLATTHPWPEVERTLRALLAADGGEMEVIVCAAAGGEPPAGWGDERLRVVSGDRDESVFALRARGLAVARGEVVAITEDHCVPAPDWPAALLAAHARHPAAAALSGAVGNGAVDDAWDWANFLLTFAEHMRPLDDAPAARAPSVANGSFKRSLVSLPPAPAAGWLELELMPDLVGAGRVARDGGPLVVHDQTHGGWRGTLSAHFHNGRASAGLEPRLAIWRWRTLALVLLKRPSAA